MRVDKRELSETHRGNSRPGIDPGMVDAARRAQRGDEDGFDALVVGLGPSVYRFLVVRLANEAEAKDALQETFVAAWKAFPTLKQPESVRAWLLSIAMRKASQVVSARPPLDHEPVPDTGVPDAGELIEIRDALDHLPPHMREVLLVRSLLGLSEREAAKALQVPVGTIKSRVSRARQQLAVLLVRTPVTRPQEGDQDAAER